VRWCAGRGIVPFPAEPAAVCAYLTECAEQGLSPATIDSACSAIGHQHRSHGVGGPVDQDAVRQVRRGLRRIIGRAPRRPTRPRSVADVRQIVTVIDRTTERGVRDTVILLFGFAGALRRSELAALTLADLEPKPGGLLLHLRRSKTDQEARGQEVGVAHGQYALTVKVHQGQPDHLADHVPQATQQRTPRDRPSRHRSRRVCPALPMNPKPMKQMEEETMANYSRWTDAKGKRPAPAAEIRAGIEQDLALGQLIYDLRTDAGLSQRELARMGTTQSVISRLEEGGGARNRIDTLARVATALNRHLVVSFPEKIPAKMKDAVQVA
jgi:ribosome-binding protein aMBF1 (putative translation factor)